MPYVPRTYSTDADLSQDGASLFLRPYMLPHRVDYGLRGTSDGEPLFLNRIGPKARFVRNWSPLNSKGDSLIVVMTTKEVQHQLCQLQLLNGCQTNPNVPGVEKMVGCVVQSQWLFKASTKLTGTDLQQPQMASPGRLFVVKGWNRSVCMLGILYACFEKPEILQERFQHKFQFGIKINNHRNDMQTLD